MRRFSVTENNLRNLPDFKITIGLSAFFVVLLVLRHPAGILNSDFWAEDGWVWYPDAYLYGWKSLLFPHSGYFQTFPRLIALLAQPFPVLYGPAIFATIAVFIQTLPATFLVSSRLDSAWPSFLPRILFATVYILLPNSFEEMGNITNSQWFLSILALTVCISEKPATATSFAFDFFVLVISGLTGPFCIVLFPIVLLNAFYSAIPLSFTRLAVLGFASIIQGLTIIRTLSATRALAPLGASFIHFCRIFTLQIEAGLFLGSHVMSRIVDTAVWQSDPFQIFMTITGMGMLGIALWKGTVLFRLCALYGISLFAASLYDPVISFSELQWNAMAIPGVGQRYYLLPMLVFIGVAFTFAANENLVLKVTGVLCVIVIVSAASGDFPYPSYPKTDFSSEAKAFEHAPHGAEIKFTVRPPNVAPMILIKQ